MTLVDLDGRDMDAKWMATALYTWLKDRKIRTAALRLTVSPHVAGEMMADLEKYPQEIDAMDLAQLERRIKAHVKAFVAHRTVRRVISGRLKGKGVPRGEAMASLRELLI